MYALNLANDGRVLSVCMALSSTPKEMPRVDSFPENVADYLYIDGEFIYDPIPEPEPEPPTPDRLDVIEAQVLYTAMLTDTLIEEE